LGSSRGGVVGVAGIAGRGLATNADSSGARSELTVAGSGVSAPIPVTVITVAKTSGNVRSTQLMGIRHRKHKRRAVPSFYHRFHVMERLRQPIQLLMGFDATQRVVSV
jgi:hypothetical protein